MDKAKTIEGMSKYFNEIYVLAINDETVPDELILELDRSVVDYELGVNIDSWLRTLNKLDELNARLVKLAKEKPEIYEGCRILNRKLVMLMDGMKNVMQKDMNVTGWIRNQGRIEAVL